MRRFAASESSMVLFKKSPRGRLVPYYPISEIAMWYTRGIESPAMQQMKLSSRNSRVPNPSHPHFDHRQQVKLTSACRALSLLDRKLNSQQVRQLSSSAWMPDMVQNFSIWGGSGYILKLIHADGQVPYWACFSLTAIGLRTLLVPVVVWGAHTMAKGAKVIPEIQFAITMFQNDLKKLRANNRGLYEQRLLFTENLRTVGALYRLHNINPLMVFISPLIQIPVFWYFATDLRKIVNGADPALAQQLTDSSFWWVQDLTEPDPWYGLPIAAGAMLYWNVEVAIGRRSLSGPVSAKADFAVWLKDAFQSLAVFMPCFVSQSPSGLQIYLVSSFTFTLIQGAALRNDYARTFLGLPLMGSPPEEPRVAKEFMEFKRLEQRARELRGDGPVLGRNVLAVGFETSFAGNYRPSTIEGSGRTPEGRPAPTNDPVLPASKNLNLSAAVHTGPIVDGVSAPRWQLEEQLAERLAAEEVKGKNTAMSKSKISEGEYLDHPTEEAMDAANRGVILAERDEQPPKRIQQVSAERLKRKEQAAKKGGRRKRR